MEGMSLPRVNVGGSISPLRTNYGENALTNSLTLTFFRGTFFVLNSTKESTTTKCRLARRYVFALISRHHRNIEIGIMNVIKFRVSEFSS